ncbi:MAG: DUF2914 domain-containing protein [Thermodesulfobacteriota bacterium]
MKSHKVAVLRVVSAILVLFGMTLLAYGQEKAEPKGTKEKAGLTISRAVIGTGVENREPVGVAETFPATTEKVYCFIEATDIPKDSEVTFVWFHGKDEKLKTTLPLKEGKRWRTSADKSLRGLKGDWKAEIKDAQGNLLKEVKFKVE